MKRKVKSWLSKVNFELGRDPSVLRYKNDNCSRYIPTPYRAVLVISADFELAWAWRYARGLRSPMENALQFARRARQNIPKILDMCDRYQIPMTWATVGHLFLEACHRDGNVPHSHLHQVAYHENAYWKFDRGNWFDDDPCTSWKASPEWYAPDLVTRILDSNNGHEIACHTFSHIDCRDEVCAPQVFIDEVQECKKSAARYGLQLRSFVHPGHLIGSLDLLHRLGFRSFRTDFGNVLGYPSKHKSGLWELKSTMELVYKQAWSVDYHVYKYREVLERALKYRRLCLFWFHPSIHSIFIAEIMPRLFECIYSKRRVIWITTIRDYVSWLDAPANGE